MTVRNTEPKVFPGWIPGFLSIIVLIWMFGGLAAFIMSVVCFGKSTKQKAIIGIVLAIFLGPFYWLYYSMSQNYCSSRL